MDWNKAIEKNREALKRILAMLVATAGLAIGQSPPQGGRSAVVTLPRHLHRAVLRLLRPAEAATRRLIIVAARGLVVTLPPARPGKVNGEPATQPNCGPVGVPPPESPRVPSLPLLDPLPRWNRRARRPAALGVPRISVPGFTVPFPVRLPLPDDPIDGTRLALRLNALTLALDDLPAQARRFARWRARRDEASVQIRQGRDEASAQARQGRHRGRAHRLSPLRPGRPPGSCRRPVHEIHEVLNVVHGLAFWALKPPDTS
jgi:hypothetical protein